MASIAPEIVNSGAYRITAQEPSVWPGDPNLAALYLPSSSALGPLTSQGSPVNLAVVSSSGSLGVDFVRQSVRKFGGLRSSQRQNIQGSGSAGVRQQRRQQRHMQDTSESSSDGDSNADIYTTTGGDSMTVINPNREITGLDRSIGDGALTDTDSRRGVSLVGREHRLTSLSGLEDETRRRGGSTSANRGRGNLEVLGKEVTNALFRICEKRIVYSDCIEEVPPPDWPVLGISVKPDLQILSSVVQPPSTTATSSSSDLKAVEPVYNSLNRVISRRSFLRSGCFPTREHLDLDLLSQLIERAIAIRKSTADQLHLINGIHSHSPSNPSDTNATGGHETTIQSDYRNLMSPTGSSAGDREESVSHCLPLLKIDIMRRSPIELMHAKEEGWFFNIIFLTIADGNFILLTSPLCFTFLHLYVYSWVLWFWLLHDLII
ncbi:unnamed protein product [Protopolystoma xenopodis]|uniref:Uncharacterized protein n=1 Tax=Protopolystoma xenopodis TaxID=117903 RepID=A0A448XHX5_9PLAT|nr:unnamed protein product [Protopolystoma xenopodis]